MSAYPGDGLPYDFRAEMYDAERAALRSGRDRNSRSLAYGEDKPSRAEAARDEA